MYIHEQAWYFSILYIICKQLTFMTWATIMFCGNEQNISNKGLYDILHIILSFSHNIFFLWSSNQFMRSTLPLCTNLRIPRHIWYIQKLFKWTKASAIFISNLSEIFGIYLLLFTHTIIELVDTQYLWLKYIRSTLYFFLIHWTLSSGATKWLFEPTVPHSVSGDFHYSYWICTLVALLFVFHQHCWFQENTYMVFFSLWLIWVSLSTAG